MPNKIIIIGAGLTGLTLAYLFQQKGLAVQIIEARGRHGGRIHTLKSESNTPIEMGATWFGSKHKHLLQLLNELDISYFPQFNLGKSLFEAMSFTAPQEFEVPPNAAPSFRIVGGTQRLIEELVRRVGEENILLNTQINSIIDRNENILLIDNNENTYQANKVISTLPPNLLLSTIQFEPSLPEDLVHISNNTHTWMGESIKFAVEYKKPFWRNRGYSGAIFSHAGIASEIHDHCNFENSGFVLKGFLGGAAGRMNFEEREKRLIAQLFKYFGADANDYIKYSDRLWVNEKHTYSAYQAAVLPHQNNGHLIFQSAVFGNKFFIAGSETARHFPGYMDGAVASAFFVSNKINL